MDLTLALEVSAAIIAGIQQLAALHTSMTAGTITPAEAQAQLATLASSLTSQEAANKAAALAEEASRLPVKTV